MQATTLTMTRGPIWPSLGMAAVLSLGLFWLLASIIARHGQGVQKMETLPTIDFVRLKRDTEVETTQRRKPPPPPEPPPPPQKLQIVANNVAADSVSMDVPSLGLSANVGGGPFVGELGGGMAGMFDGDIIPIQRVQPIYPADARRAGVTGFVQLEILVNADGSVRTAKVLEAKPKGLFEAAAVTAVMRWRFKPKVVNGQPVTQRGAQKIDFNLNQAAS